jgi:hypothetical protein
MAAPLSDPIDIPERPAVFAPTPVSTPTFTEGFKGQHIPIRKLPTSSEHYNHRAKRVLYNSPSDLSIIESNPSTYYHKCLTLNH